MAIEALWGHILGKQLIKATQSISITGALYVHGMFKLDV